MRFQRVWLNFSGFCTNSVIVYTGYIYGLNKMIAKYNIILQNMDDRLLICPIYFPQKKGRIHVRFHKLYMHALNN